VVSTIVRPAAAAWRNFSMTLRFRNRIHAGRELVEEDDRGIDHEDLGDLNAPAEAAAQVHHLTMCLGPQAKVLEHTLGARADLVRGAKPWNRANVRGLSRTVRNSSTAVSESRTEIRRRTSSGAATTSWPESLAAPDVGCASVESTRSRVVAGAIRSEQTEESTPRATSNVKSRWRGRSAVRGGIELDEIVDTNSRFDMAVLSVGAAARHHRSQKGKV